MLSHPDDSDDGLLGESTYEILSDLSVPSHSDDDDDLSSLASLADEDIDEDDEEVPQQDSVEFTFPNPNTEEPKDILADESPAYAESVPDVPDELEATGIPSYTGLDIHEPPAPPKFPKGEETMEDATIRFRCDLPPPGEYTTVSHGIQEFTDEFELEEMKNILNIPDSTPNLFSVLRCSLAADPMNIKDTFRVLYIGDESSKEDIIRKLGAALVVQSTDESVDTTNSSDRFNVVPITSFGNASGTPEVELVESFGFEMAVDTCASAAGVNDGKGGDLLTLVIKPRLMIRSIRTSSGCRLHAPGWRLPHLAIFYCGSNDDFQKRQTRSYARAFAIRHKIPYLTISERKMYGSSENFQVDYDIVHMALESQQTDENGVRIREVHRELPIDLQSYLNLDVQQLSRNLGVVVKQKDDDQSNMQEKKQQPWKRVFQIANDIIDDGMSSRNVNMIAILVAGVLLSSVFLVLSIAMSSLSSQGKLYLGSTSVSVANECMTTSTLVATSLGIAKSQPRADPPKYTSSASSSIVASSSVKTTTSISKPVSSSITSVSTISSGVTSLSITDLPPLSLNETNEFTMYTISDGSIVLRSPKKFAALRKAPAVIVHVKRRSQTVPVEVSKLFRGVYAIRMDLSDAWGLLNITIRTESKPLVNQSFLLDLGNPWLSKEAWKRSVLATSSDLKKAVNRASSKANDYAQKLHESGMKQIDMAKKEVMNLRLEAGKLRKDIKFMQEEAVKLRKDLAKQSEVAKKRVETQLKALRNGFGEFNIGQYLGPIGRYKKQLDNQVQKARKGANKIWKKSSKSKDTPVVKNMKTAKSCGSRKWLKGKGGCKNSR